MEKQSKKISKKTNMERNNNINYIIAILGVIIVYMLITTKVNIYVKVLIVGVLFAFSLIFNTTIKEELESLLFDKKPISETQFLMIWMFLGCVYIVWFNIKYPECFESDYVKYYLF